MGKQNIIADKTFAFALEIIQLYSQLKNHREYELAKQILKAGTSIGANVRESTAAASRKDFINKIAIASKEARETVFWLEILQSSQLVEGDYIPYLEKAREIVNILTAIIKTSQKTEI